MRIESTRTLERTQVPNATDLVDCQHDFVITSGTVGRGTSFHRGGFGGALDDGVVVHHLPSLALSRPPSTEVPPPASSHFTSGAFCGRSRSTFDRS